MPELQESLIGEHSGDWTIVGYAGTRQGSRMWNCQCLCGEIGQLSTSEVNNKKKNLRCAKCARKRARELKPHWGWRGP